MSTTTATNTGGSAGAGAGPAARIAQLCSTALLGTDRAGVKAKGGNAAAGLLREAAVLFTHQRTGRRSLPGPKSIAPCPVDPLPPVNAACSATLRRLLADPDAALINEWAELAKARGKRVPDALAAPLLDWWIRHPQASTDVGVVLGVRLDWLAGLNPAWRKRGGVGALPDDLDGAWQTTTGAERLALLRTVRKLQPEKAEGLLRATFAQDSADERRTFIECFADNLSIRDEAFLEWVLDDRSKVVRSATARLLATLPESKLVQRMLDRAAAMVKVEETRKGILRKVVKTVTIEPPKEWDATWERDGLEEKPPAGTGKRAWWLQQVLTFVPPAGLAERVGLDATALLDALTGSDYARQVMDAVAKAAAKSGDPVWCADLIRRQLANKKTTADDLLLLWQRLSGKVHEELFFEVLDSDRLTLSEMLNILGFTLVRWPPKFSAEACRRLKPKKVTKDNTNEAWTISPALEKAAKWLDPTAAPDFSDLVTGIFGDAPPPLAIRSVDYLRLRNEMQKEFAS